MTDALSISACHRSSYWISRPIRAAKFKEDSMAKYVLFYYGGSAGNTDKERADQLQQWGAWFGKLGKNIADQGAPFSGKVKTVGSNGGAKDGAIGQQASGYSIVEANSIEEATNHAKGSPILSSGGQIAVYETHTM